MTAEATRLNADGGDGRESITAADVAALVGGELIGDPLIRVRGVAPLDRAAADELSFLANARYARWFADTRAGIVLVAPEFRDVAGSPGARVIIKKPIDALVSILPRFHHAEVRGTGVHASAVVSPRATLGRGVTIDALAVIGDNVVIGDGSWIGAHVSIGEGCVIGADSRLHANAVLYPRVELGERVVVHSGAQLGRDGFGWLPRPGLPERIPHVGRCVISDDVEIGANSCVDRGSIDDTIIGVGTKIDSLVHIAHNVRIGRLCFLAAQVGIAGSARLEDGVQVGGQAGLQGHITVGAGATLGGQAGVLGDVPAGQMWSGYPARPHREQLRSHAALSRLVQIIRPLERLLKRESPE